MKDLSFRNSSSASMSLESNVSLEKLMRMNRKFTGSRTATATPNSLLVSISAATALVAIFLILAISKLALPAIDSNQVYSNLETEGLSSKHTYLAQLELDQQRLVASQVHYLSDVIHRTRRATRAPKNLAFSIVRQSRRSNYDPFFVAAVMKAESTFRQNAKSHVGALGLMQIMPATGRYVSNRMDLKWVGPNRLIQDADYNIHLGIEYLKYLENYFDGDLEKVLIAYNWGPTNLKRALQDRRSPPSSSVHYARTIISDSIKWRSEFSSKKEDYRYLNVNYISEPLLASHEQSVRPG